MVLDALTEVRHDDHTIELMAAEGTIPRQKDTYVFTRVHDSNDYTPAILDLTREFNATKDRCASFRRFMKPRRAR